MVRQLFPRILRWKGRDLKLHRASQAAFVQRYGDRTCSASPARVRAVFLRAFGESPEAKSHDVPNSCGYDIIKYIYTHLIILSGIITYNLKAYA